MNRPEVNCPTTLIISVETPRQPVSAYVHVRTLATQSDHFRPSYRQRRVNASGRRARVELFAALLGAMLLIERSRLLPEPRAFATFMNRKKAG